MNEDLLRKVIARVTQSPSCVDMGWEWDIRTVFYPAVHGQLEEAGFLIRCSFQRPDTNTGDVGRGWGRFFHLNPDESVTGVVKTMKLAMTRIVDHEIDEMIRYNGERIFDPHYDISDLVEMARKQWKGGSHCRRADGSSPVGVCGGTGETCSCECSTCQDPNA